jgi:uracil-DNA glycosylase
MLASAPRAHRDAQFLAEKQARLNEPHVKPVQDLVHRVRKYSGDPAVPFVDPDSGGVNARVLFLLEAPAAAAAHGSTMLSPDNDDATAANIFRLYTESGLRRAQAIHWNAVPWYIGDGQRIRAAKRADVAEGNRWLTELIELLPDLRLVVAMGGAARDAFAMWLLTEHSRLLHWLVVPHPSQRVKNVSPDSWALLQSAFRIAASVAGDTALSDETNVEMRVVTRR